MIRADLAIGASGTTSWERLCLGLPLLFIQLPLTNFSCLNVSQRKGYLYAF